MLVVDHLSKSYVKGVLAVDNLSITVNAGDLFGFIGHNGAGKTTTLQAIAGILPFDDGIITLDGVNLRDDPIAVKQNIAYIPDQPDVYEYLTGLQFLNFIADIYRVSADDRKQRVSELAETLQLTGVLNNPIHSYSHGMRQKLLIMSALVHRPRLLLLDEPFVGLDPIASFTLKNMMRDYCAQGNAIFFSTHVLEVAEKLCNKIAVIRSGRLIACGDMESVTGDATLEQTFLELSNYEG